MWCHGLSVCLLVYIYISLRAEIGVFLRAECVFANIRVDVAVFFFLLLFFFLFKREPVGRKK